MKKILFSLLLAILFYSVANAQQNVNAGPSHVIPESGLSLGGGTMAGPLAYNVCTQTANDTTPAMGTIPGGCNVLETSDANTGASSGDITTFDDDLVGMILFIVGKGGANPTNIADGGNFQLEYAWEGALDRVLVLYVQAANDYVEISRHNGIRFYDDVILVNSNISDFLNAQVFISKSDTGHSDGARIGLVAESKASGVGAIGIGLKGIGEANTADDGIGVDGQAEVDATSDTGSAIAIRGQSTTTHVGGANIGVYTDAQNGVTNYSLYIANGDVISAVSVDWDLLDDDTSSLSYDTSGKIGILEVVTTNTSEGIKMSGYIDVEGKGAIGSNANWTDWSNTQLVVSKSDTGHSDGAMIGIAAEAEASGSGVIGIGIKGVAETNTSDDAIGLDGQAEVDASTDTGIAIGVRGQSTTTHAGEKNVAFWADAQNGATDYAFYIANGDVLNAVPIDWDLVDNSATALSFDATGKAGMLVFDTANSSEQIELGVLLALSNGETISNATDGSITFTGVGGSNNEDLSYDYESTANTVGISTSTGVTSVVYDDIGITLSSADIDLDGNSLLIDEVGTSYLDGSSDGQIDVITDGSIILRLDSTIIAYGSVVLNAGQTITTNTNGHITIDAHGTGTSLLKDQTLICDGACGTPGVAIGAGDLYIESDLEIDGTGDFKDYVNLGTAGGTTAEMISWNSGLYGAVTGYYNDGLHFSVYSGNGKRNYILTDSTNVAKDHGHGTASANPTWIGHSVYDVDTNDTRYWALTHDGGAAAGDMNISTGSGGLDLTGIAGNYMIIPRILDAAPSEPFACASAYDGGMVYVDDTNDTAYGRICICANLDGTGYDWRVIDDIVGTACPFF